MATLFTITALTFVVAVLVVAAFALFEVSPFGRHKDQYRDAAGRRRWDPPNLEDGHY
jgi:hypothetical protein